MVWTVTFESQADSRDADYIHKSGKYGIIDDANSEDMLKLLFKMRLARYAENHYDDGCVSVGKREDVLNEIVGGKLTREVADRMLTEDGDSFSDCLADELYNEFCPDDPADDSRAHDLSITWKIVPGENRVSTLSESWVESTIK